MKFEIDVHEGEVDADLIEYIEWVQKYRGYRSFALAFEEVLKNGKSRFEQLRKYNEKRKDPESKFRPYAPLKLSETERGNAKRAAIAEGVAPRVDKFPWRCTVTQDESGGGDPTRRCTRERWHEGEHKYTF